MKALKFKKEKDPPAKRTGGDKRCALIHIALQVLGTRLVTSTSPIGLRTILTSTATPHLWSFIQHFDKDTTNTIKKACTPLGIQAFYRQR
jgi:hypothetical protein